MEEEKKKNEEENLDVEGKVVENIAPKGVHQGGASTPKRGENLFKASSRPSSTENKDTLKGTSKKTEESLSEEGKENIKKELNNSQNKQLKNILIIFGSLLILFLLGFALVDSVRHFESRGLEFKVVKEGNLIFYNVDFPIYSSITGNHIADYNIYLRKDPRKLENILLKGGMVLRDNMVIDIKEEFNCNGDGIIAMANFVKSFKLIGTEVMKDPTAGCDEEGRYVHVTIQQGEETFIEQIGPACFNINIKDCEILEGTEKFIVEAFSSFNKKIYMDSEEE